MRLSREHLKMDAHSAIIVIASLIVWRGSLLSPLLRVLKGSRTIMRREMR
jgi:hypothetical protein